MDEFQDSQVDSMLSTPQAEPTVVKPTSNRTSQPRLWDDLDIKPREINTLKFKTEKNYSFAVFENGRITPTKIEAIKKIAERLFQLGFLYRSPADNRSKVDQAIRSIPGARIQVYKLWAKHKDDNNGFQVVSEAPTRISYEVACGVKKKFLDFKPMVRCLVAREAQIMLGANCDDPVQFMLVYTDKGETVIKGSDLSSLSSVVYPMQVASRANINLFNINSPTFVEEFKKFLEIKPKHPPTQDKEIVIGDKPVEPTPVEPAQQPEIKPVDDFIPTEDNDLF